MASSTEIRLLVLEMLKVYGRSLDKKSDKKRENNELKLSKKLYVYVCEIDRM